LQRGSTRPAAAPRAGQIAPNSQAERVRWSCGAAGRVPRGRRSRPGWRRSFFKGRDGVAVLGVMARPGRQFAKPEGAQFAA